MFIPVGFANAVMLFQITGDAELMQTAIGIDISGAGGDMVEVGERVGNSFMSICAASISSSCTLVAVDVVEGQDGGDPITTTVDINESGTDGDFPLPPNTALLVKKSTTLGGRAGRGRMFIPGFAMFGSLDAAGVLGGAYRTALQGQITDWYDSLLEDTPGPALPPVLFHATSSPVPSEITALTVDAKVATQRRRLRG